MLNLVRNLNILKFQPETNALRQIVLHAARAASAFAANVWCVRRGWLLLIAVLLLAIGWSGARAKFGAACSRYAADVPGWFPHIRRFAEHGMT